MKKKVKNRIFLNTMILMAVFLFGANSVRAAQITPETILRLVNEARLREGVEALTQNDRLQAAAEEKLGDMIEKKYFAHTSPEGKNPWHWISRSGYDYKYAGENLAISFLTAEKQQEAWMKSETHRKNILNPNYLETGIAVGAGEIGGETSIIAVQTFGTLVGATAPKPGGKTNRYPKMVPQVLSSHLPDAKVIEPKESFWGSQNLRGALDGLSVFGALALALSIVLAPLAFLSVAFEKIWLDYKIKKQMAM